MTPHRIRNSARSAATDSASSVRYPRLKAVTDIAHKWVQIAAIVIGGAWAFYHFMLGGGANWDVTLDLSTEMLPYKGNSRLLVVHVKSENQSARSIDIDKENGSFKVVIRQVPDGLPEKSVVDAESGEILATRDLLPDDGWQLLPHSKFDDTFGIVLPSGIQVLINAELALDDSAVTARRIVQLNR